MTHEHEQPDALQPRENWEGDPALESLLDEALAPQLGDADLAAMNDRILAATASQIAVRGRAEQTAAETPDVIARIGMGAPAWRAAAAVLIASGVLVAAWFGATQKIGPTGTGTDSFAALEAAFDGLEAEASAAGKVAPELLEGEIATLELQVAMAQPMGFWDDAPGSLDDVIDQVETDLMSGSWDRVF